MTRLGLNRQLAAITPADQGAMEAAKQRWDSIAKPLHGLGKLEDLIIQAAGAAGTWPRPAGRIALAWAETIGPLRPLKTLTSTSASTVSPGA